jgi:hypothetical protein
MVVAARPESTMLAIIGRMSRTMLERYSHIRIGAKRSDGSGGVPTLRKPANGNSEAVSAVVAKESDV